MKIVFKTVLLILFHITSFSQSLKVKTAFGNAGKTITNLANDAATYNRCALLLPDGKVLVGGTGITRLYPSGIIDSSFGLNGSSIIQVYPEVESMELLPDGKIVALLNNSGVIVSQRLLPDGAPDHTYAGARITKPGMDLYCQDTRLQPDGKLLITGAMDSAGYQRCFVARLMADGSPDTSFNTTGIITPALSDGDSWGSAVDLQSDGRIIVAGWLKETASSNTKLAVLRLSVNGSRDMSFNGTGIYSYTSPAVSAGEYGRVLHVLPADKILVAGGSNAKLLVARLSPNGSPDNSFNGTGMLITQIGEFNSPEAIHIRPDGRILVTGSTAFYNSVNSWDYAAFQFSPDGLPDNSFSGDGKVNFPLEQNEHCGGSVLLTDGKFILTGDRDSLPLMNSVRFTANGSPDNTYGLNGLNYYYIRGTDDVIKKILLQPDGKIIALGDKGNGLINQSPIALTRYHNDGRPDSSFGSNGMAFFNSPDIAFRSALLQPDGKILVAGIRYESLPVFTSSIALFRFHANGTLDYSFADPATGIFLQPDASIPSQGNSLALLSTGKIIVAGTNRDQEESLMTLRINPNGTADNTYGLGGRSIIPADTTTNELVSMALLPDGKIILAGNKVLQDTLLQFFVMRILNDGNSDNSFGSNGLNTVLVNAEFAVMTSLALTSEGKIILGGDAYQSFPNTVINPCLARFTSNGSIDTSFNGTGKAVYQNPAPGLMYTETKSIAIHPDSSTWIAGVMYHDTGYDTYLFSVDQRGKTDSTIAADGTGWRLGNHSGLYGYADEIRISPDSSILVGEGTLNANGDMDFVVSAYRKIPGIAGRVYTFQGDGNWSNAMNWSYNTVPPAILPPGSIINIAPVAGGACVVNVVQEINTNGCVNVKTGANVVIPGDLRIMN